MGKARTPKTKPAEPTEVVVRYDLFDLPTAFHKAGLAGLLMLVESLKTRKVLTSEEARYETSATAATVTFTEPIVRKLMDDIYDARSVEVAVKSKWPGAEVKREEMVEEEVDGKKFRTKRFVYDVVQPRGQFLRDHYPEMPEERSWLKLWRDMLWNIPRGRPMTREPYNQRAAGESCKEGPNAWAELVKVRTAGAGGLFHTGELSSALFPGAQAVNAEGVPFEGRAEQNLLLHFWPFAVLLFVPQSVDTDGKTDFVGYTLAVPEVANLTAFVGDYPRLLAALAPAARGYRPAQAVIDIPAEGALAFLDDLAVLTGLEVETGELRFSIGGVEYLHLVKTGNNVKAAAAGRVSPNRRLLAGYRAIVCPKDESTRYRNPLFRRGLLVALLDGELWYRPFARALSNFDAEVFVRHPRKADDKGPPQFADDAAKKFRHETMLFSEKLKRYEDMPEPDPKVEPRPKPEPTVIVNRVVRTYLLTRSKDKSGIDPDKYKTAEGDTDYKAIPTAFNDAKQKLAQSLILEFRSRRDQAFVDHFAVTFFSVTQRLNEPDRLELADMLTADTRRDDLKTLTLLALSANS